MTTCRIYLPGSTWECTIVPHPNGAEVYPELLSTDLAYDSLDLDLEREEAIEQVRSALRERETTRAA